MQVIVKDSGIGIKRNTSARYSILFPTETHRERHRPWAGYMLWYCSVHNGRIEAHSEGAGKGPYLYGNSAISDLVITKFKLGWVLKDKNPTTFKQCHVMVIM